MYFVNYYGILFLVTPIIIIEYKLLYKFRKVGKASLAVKARKKQMLQSDSGFENWTFFLSIFENPKHFMEKRIPCLLEKVI